MAVYDKIRSQLKTGDIVLFSGKGGISAGIKWATFSRWSHVGMVVNMTEYDFVTLWESTTLSSLADLDTQRPVKGVQLVPLSARVATYPGEIAIRQLRDCTLGPEDVSTLMDFRKKVKGKAYEENLIELIRSAYDGPWGNNQEELSSLFCSELVAETYQRLGLLGEEKPSNEYTPADFSARVGLELQIGRLGKERFITKA